MSLINTGSILSARILIRSITFLQVFFTSSPRSCTERKNLSFERAIFSGSSFERTQTILARFERGRDYTISFFFFTAKAPLQIYNSCDNAKGSNTGVQFVLVAVAASATSHRDQRRKSGLYFRGGRGEKKEVYDM